MLQNLFAIGFYLILILFSLVKCSSKKETSAEQRTPFDTLKLVAGTTQHLSDKQVAQAICGSCHVFPEPDLLDKQTWVNGVLPHMALRLGFLSFNNNPYANLTTDELESVVKANIFPYEPLIDSATWDKIVKYYKQQAPEKALVQANKPTIIREMPCFKTTAVDIPGTKYPLVTLLEYDAKNKHWYIGDRQSNFYRLNHQFQTLDSLKVDSPPADITFDATGQLQLLTMGVMDPNDRAAGKIFQADPLQPLVLGQLQPTLTGLVRPVHLTLADLNSDGLEDKIVCEFGQFTGKLAWYENAGDQQYKQHILKLNPGARKTIILDINQDKLPDIISLMTQGDEGIFAYINDGKGHFREIRLLRFPPVYGSSDFEMEDFNKDGLLDILYVNGDNADFSPSLKRYHGVRIFVNTGKNTFEQQWFYPMHGATKALAKDFDQDGDLDLCAIAFFPDFVNAPDEGFVYFENSGDFTFQPHTFNNASEGRWLTMEAGDFDQDDDIDIALGSFIYSATPVPEEVRQKWMKKGYDVLLLENQRTAIK